MTKPVKPQCERVEPDQARREEPAGCVARADPDQRDDREDEQHDELDAEQDPLESAETSMPR